MVLAEDTKLYRIIGLEAFISMLIYKEERYVRPIDSWEDTFEGYMLHQLDTDNGRKNVLDRLYILSGKDTNATIRNLSKLLRCRYTCYGQCWSKNKDSDAMWRIYSYNNKAIQIISSVDRIRSMIKESAWPQLETIIDSVEYDINDEKEALNKILMWGEKIDSAYFHKRPAFMHEAEVRVLLNDFMNYEHVDAFAAQAIGLNMKFVDKKSTVPEQILQAFFIMTKNNNGYITAAPKEIKLKIHNTKEYIEGVRVHPQAADWYVNLVKKICTNYKMPFLGQSNLYRSTV